MPEKTKGKKEKGAAEDEMMRQHHRLNAHEFEQTPGDSGTEEPGILQYTGSQSVEHKLVTEQQEADMM